MFILEKSCSHRYVLPKTDDHLRALALKFGNSFFDTRIKRCIRAYTRYARTVYTRYARIHRFQRVITFSFMGRVGAQRCRSRCNIEGDRKDIKFQLLAFDILKSSIEAFQETGTFQNILSTGSWIVFFQCGKMRTIVIFQLIFPEA